MLFHIIQPTGSLKETVVCQNYTHNKLTMVTVLETDLKLSLDQRLRFEKDFT